MNDEMKNKSGKVKVMYVRSDDDSDKRTQNPRTGKGGGRPASSRADGGRRPARDDRNNRGDDRKRDDRKRDDRKRDDVVRDGGSPWRTVSRAPGEEATEKPITAVSAEKALSIRKCCVVSVRKRPVSTVRTPVRPCSRAARSVSFVHGLFRA